MSTRNKILIGVGIWLAIAIALFVVFGSEGENDHFKPQNEFKLEPWIEIKIGGLDLSFNKAVLYLLIACGLTIGAMVFVARRMQDKPNRTQTIVEGAYELTHNQIARNNMPSEAAAKWFPFVATLFFFIWFSNMLGYIPLPVNTEETIDDLRDRLPRLRPLRGHRQPLDPAGADADRLRPLPGRGHQGPRPRSSTSRAGCPRASAAPRRSRSSSSR